MWKEKKKRNKCQMQPQLTVWITASKQFCLESSLECQQRWRRCAVAGKLFHTRAAATGKAQSPTVDKRVEGTLSASVNDYQSTARCK